MTRQEFIDTVNDYSDLREFCSDNGCSYLDGLYDEDERDDLVNELIMDWARQDTWQDLKDRLDDIPNYNGWFRLDDDGDWIDVDNDNDFDYDKTNVLEWADDHDVFDPESEEEELEPEPMPEPEPEIELPPIEDEDFSATDLYDAVLDIADAFTGAMVSTVSMIDTHPGVSIDASEPDIEPDIEPEPEPDLTPITSADLFSLI